ncbi:MAG: redoxin domain-containing protein [Nitrospiraceae bacterium]
MTASTHCFRCGGLLIPDYSGEEYPRLPTLKCINCGRTLPAVESLQSVSAPVSPWSGSGAQRQGLRVPLRVGQPAPNFRLTAVINGEPVFLHSAHYQGRWVVLCFPGSMGLSERMLLDRQGHLFARAETALLAVAPDELTRDESCAAPSAPISVPLLIDPMRRLSRLYGVRRSATPSRCHTFVIDPDNIVKFHHVHPLTIRSMEAIRRRLNPQDLGMFRGTVLSR